MYPLNKYFSETGNQSLESFAVARVLHSTFFSSSDGIFHKTYFTQLCSTFLNKLTKIIVYVVGRVKKKVCATKHPWMFIKKHDKYTSALRVDEDENIATSAL